MSLRYTALLFVIFSAAAMAKPDHRTPQDMLAGEDPKSAIMVIDFWAPWCGPCVEINQHLDELAMEMEGQFHLIRVNIDERPDLAEQFDVGSLPTVVMTRGDEVVGRFRGLRSKKAIRSFIEKAFHRWRISQVSYSA